MSRNANAVAMLMSIINASTDVLVPTTMSAYARRTSQILSDHNIQTETIQDLRLTADRIDAARVNILPDLRVLWRAFMLRAIDLLGAEGSVNTIVATNYDRMSFDEFSAFLEALKANAYGELEMLSLLNALHQQELDAIDGPDGWQIINPSDGAHWSIIAYLELCRMGASAQFN